ncbi:MAG: flagellar basal-body MS-ring/collar protein FliF [Alphaproteobacteria bacterium]
MSALIQTLRSLGGLRLMALGAVGIAGVAFFIYLSTRLSEPGMALLYAELDAKDSAQIVAKLETANVPFTLKAGGTQIYVPADKALRMRMTLAQEGLPRGGSVGYEIFDRSEGVGSSSLVQNINRLRALEGELSRTIRSIALISAARVHVVLSKRQLFARERQQPSASIILKTYRGELRDFFFSNMSERGGKLLREELSEMGPVKLRDVDEAQTTIVNSAKELAASGEIMLSDDKDDELIY